MSNYTVAVLTVLIGLAGSTAARASECDIPFDPGECYCTASPHRYVLVGHLVIVDRETRFEVERSWGADVATRFPEGTTVILESEGYTESSARSLLVSADGIQWQQSLDGSPHYLGFAADRTLNGTTFAEGCPQSVPMDDVAEFLGERVDATSSCNDAARKRFGLKRADTCDGGCASGAQDGSVGAFAAVLVSMLAARRRRPNTECRAQEG